MRTDRTDRAVSPIIAIILVVAITVVLAGVIGTFVLNLGSDVSKEAQAGATVEFRKGTGDGEVRITYVERGNTERIEVRYSVDPSSNSVSAPDGTVLQEPGNSVRLTEDASNPDETITVSVTVVAFESDNERSVILQKEGEI